MRFEASILIAAVLTILGCGQAYGPPPEDAGPETAAPLSVYTVNYPLRYFAERIGGELVDATFPAPADVDPALWSPDAETVAAYQGADLILLNGAGYAKWTQLASLPLAKLVDTSVGFQHELIPLQEGVTHTHGPGGEHSHKGFEFTTWLDPSLAILQAEALAEALVRVRPQDETSFRANLDSLTADLTELDKRQAAAAERLAGQPLLFSRPVYQYLIRRYELDARSVHWESGEIPTESMWRELGKTLTEHPASWMIWEGEPLPETVHRLEAAGVKSLVYQPCANVLPEGDLLAVMSANVAAFETLAP